MFTTTAIDSSVPSTGGVATTYDYDANGNRTSKTVGASTTTYIYDVANRLVETKVNNITVFTASYDGRTRRIAKTESGQTTLFRYDGGTNFQERRGGNIITELVRAGGLGGGIGSILYSDKTMAPAAGPWEGFLYNAVGHTVLLSDASGVPSQRNVYEAFGQVVASFKASALTPDSGSSSGDPPLDWVPNGSPGGTLHGRVATADGVTGAVYNSTPEDSVLTLSLSTVPFQQGAATQLHIRFDWEASVYYGGEFEFSLTAGAEPIAEYSEIVTLTTGSASGHTDWYIGLSALFEQTTLDDLEIYFALAGSDNDWAVIKNLRVWLTHATPTDLERNNRLANTKERDGSTGLDNHGFRYYDPDAGRYLTRDPIGYGDGLNVYHSVHNNPVNHVDPLGLSSDEAKEAERVSQRPIATAQQREAFRLGALGNAQQDRITAATGAIRDHWKNNGKAGGIPQDLRDRPRHRASRLRENRSILERSEPKRSRPLCTVYARRW